MPDELLRATATISAGGDPKAESAMLQAVHRAILSEYYKADTSVALPPGEHEVTFARAKLGPMRLLRLTVSGEIAVTRSREHIRKDPREVYLVWFVTAGEVFIKQDGKEITLRPHQFAITSSHLPFTISTRGAERSEHTSYQVIVPGYLLPDQRTMRSRAVQAFDLRQGQSAMAYNIFLSLFDNVDGLPSESSGDLAEHALRSLFSSLDEEGTSVRSNPKMRLYEDIRAYILTNLAEPGLTASKVADAFGVSGRYIYLLFKEQAASFHDFVWSSRLERARGLLEQRDGALPISEVAFSLGFSTPSHFSRSFRHRFGYSPTQARRHSSTEGLEA